MSDSHHVATTIPSAESHDAAHLPQDPNRGSILKGTKLIVAGILVLLAVGAAVTLTGRNVHANALKLSTAEQSRLFVTTTIAKAAGGNEALTLTGTLQGLNESPIYARSSGYVLRWNKDIGAHVAKGDVLAEIDTPEVDQQLSEMKAAREQAAANLDLAKSSSERWDALRKKDAVTQQEVNERNSAYAQAQANFAAADANVKRLQKLEDFKQVIAPFDGVVTRRNVNVGDLINAGNGGAGNALFTLAQIDPLRVYVYVPQNYAQRIKVGDSVNVIQPELVNQVFKGTIVRTAGAIDAATRTLQVEINLPNHDSKLLSGAYVQVALAISGSSNALLVPSNVILFRPEGARIAVADAAGKVKLHAVTIGRDLGNSLEIVSGITATDKLVLNPADSLADNDVVTVITPPKKAAP
jgi:RND family efflux transporter MFP subunit